MEFNFDLDEIVDVREKGMPQDDGTRLTYEGRVFVQFLAFGGCKNTAPIVEAVKSSGFEAVVYEDVNDPDGIGLLTMDEDPNFFVEDLRRLLKEKEFEDLTLKPEYTTLGRTYAIGHEEDLEDWLINKPRRNCLNPENPWFVIYPLRRKGPFNILDPMEQRDILMEHGMIGRAFGQAGLGNDLRLTCYGIDKNDNDFVIGLIGDDLFPLSVLVQTMRKTVQTSTYMEHMGPFFVGKAVYQAPCKDKYKSSGGGNVL